jgi:prepilin-type N-terminal cleavage/methylation domain
MNLKSEKGFTLVEVMITMVVVLLLLVGFLGSATAIQAANLAAYERSIALQDANRVIETLRSAAAVGTFPENVTDLYADGGEVSGYEALTDEVVTVDYADPEADPLDVTVTVSYSENGNRDMSVTLRTYITQRS